MRPPVFVVGAGVITAIGNSVSENLESLQAERSGINNVKNLQTIHAHLPVGEVKLTDTELRERIALKNIFSRTAMLGIKAVREALDDAKFDDLKRFRAGFISGTTVGGMDRTALFYSAFRKDNRKGNLNDVMHHSCGSITELIAAHTGLNGFISTVNTACSSSVNSIIFGCRLIQQGMLDVVVAGGTDALSGFTLNGFNSLMILDSQLCRPFDEERAGLNLGEGAGYLVLVSEKILKSVGLTSCCRISGYANTNDAFHQTASSPEGRGSFAAMEQALKMSGVSKEKVSYINAHGTGTVNNDQSEASAIKNLFGDSVPPMSSTKSYTGHTLGASGGVESVYSVLAIREGCLFPNLRFREPMATVHIRPETSYQAGQKIKHVMNNAFGFGGNCSSIIFSQN